jgi:hypothetical protein
MAIEINQRRKSNFPPWAVISLFILAVLVIGVIVTYLYFYVTAKSMAEKIVELDQSSIELNKKVAAKENELLLVQQRIEDFKSLVLNHKDFMNVFNLLEEKAIPNIKFTSFDFNRINEDSIILKGTSSNFIVIGQQINILQNDNLIKKVNLTDVKITDEGVLEFALKVVLNPEIFSFNDKSNE